ncbi:diguanylate cyclase [Actinoplanes sp. NPDC051346]|uniref:diguanylate cyclase n=1 Tax=Actinoplanes sp. NPDC051346 TaxID=3155048 RepID=UPI00344A8998
MTLRGRLTTAFLAVVLGPVLLGTFFVGMTVATVSRDRTVERLDHAATTVRSAMGALCGQLQAVADAVAVLPADDRRSAADQMVTRGLAAEVRIVVYTPSVDSGQPTAGESKPGPDQSGAGQGGGAGQSATTAGKTWEGRAVGRLEGGESLAEERDCAGPPAKSAPTASITAVAPTASIAAVAPTASIAAVAPTASITAVAPTASIAAVAPTASITAITASAVQDDVVVVAVAHADEDFIQRLAHTSGAAVALNRGARGPARRAIADGPGQPLPLVVSVPDRAPIPLYWLLAVAVAIVAGIAIVVARWLARSTTRPLEELAWAAGKVADGELGVRVPVRRDDEIGRLGGTFNRMTRELQAYVQALTASRDQLRGHLAILGDTLSSTHDLDRILQVILQTALSASGARAGIVLLTDPAGGDLVARCAEGLTGRWDVPDDDLASLRVPRGRGILGAVAASGEPRRGFCGLGGGLIDEPACRTYVAVPICAPATVGDPLMSGEWELHPGTLGVLALYDRLGTDEFDDADLLMLRTFAGQAGVAVHNVRMHEEAQRLSLTDPLTGLWNYRYLRESLRREVERASRFGRMLTVLVLDLDHFKEVNDTHGHAAGDAVLGEFARRVRLALREVDVAFRQGGEEFVVLLPETDAYGGVIVAERLGAAVRDDPVSVDGRGSGADAGSAVERVPISVSIGIAVFPEHGNTADRVLAAADDALYAAKHAGRDTYRLAGVTQASVSGGVDEGQFDHPESVQGASGGPQPPRQGRGR